MRDYSQGALEALSWVRSLFEDSDTQCKRCKKVIQEIEEALRDIQRGIAVDFRYRLRSY